MTRRSVNTSDLRYVRLSRHSDYVTSDHRFVELSSESPTSSRITGSGKADVSFGASLLVNLALLALNEPDFRSKHINGKGVRPFQLDKTKRRANFRGNVLVTQNEHTAKIKKD